MNRAVIAVVALCLAFAAGTSSASFAIANWLQFGGLHSGPWQRLASLGQTDVDPYARAYSHISAEIPLGSAEGQVFTASTDTQNVPLDAACDYLIEGEIPAARIFTLHVETPDGRWIKADAPFQSALHSDQLLFGNNQFKIQISAVTKPDNWLTLRASGAFKLVLNYYDVAVINDDTGNSTRLPQITRGGCANA